jgi:fucose 4-O-acetylase-like acetyltransferase
MNPMRNIRIDLLRALGLAMIVLAHVGPPTLVMQLRNFDVPLMVLVSGMSFGLSYQQDTYPSYMWRRIKRLVFPVWIFLTIYFTSIALLDLKFETLNAKRILGSYFLIDGIGYVWIIKVFLLVALVSPFIYRLHQKIPGNHRYFGSIALVFIAYEMARFLTQEFFATWPGELVQSISHYMIPYALVFAIGVRLPSLKPEETVWGMNLCLAAFILLAFLLAIETGNLVPTQAHKYPPTLYYFSYALAISLAAWLVSGRCSNLLKKFGAAKAIVLFAAQNSIWIYLWHIPLVKLIEGSYAIKFMLVLAIACLITFIQVWTVHNLIPKVLKHSASQEKIKMVLTG